MGGGVADVDVLFYLWCCESDLDCEWCLDLFDDLVEVVGVFVGVCGGEFGEFEWCVWVVCCGVVGVVGGVDGWWDDVDGDVGELL